jgi:hypothetical protein
VPCLAGRRLGETSTSRVSDAEARPGADVGAGSFATHFATVFNASTTALLAFAWSASVSQPAF